MNPGGDAAEQVVRLSLEGMEVTARITGNGAKNIALLLYAALKEEQKTKGKTRLTSMLRSGKELKVYTITQKDLPKFAKEAKRYGVLYCVLKDRKNTDPSASVDVIARAEDASKIQRITERFRFATVDRASVVGSVQRERNSLFPNRGRTADPLSAPGSGREDRSNGSIPDGRTKDRPSVREKLHSYRQESDRAKRDRSVVREASDTMRSVRRAVPKAPGKDR